MIWSITSLLVTKDCKTDAQDWLAGLRAEQLLNKRKWHKFTSSKLWVSSFELSRLSLKSSKHRTYLLKYIFWCYCFYSVFLAIVMYLRNKQFPQKTLSVSWNSKTQDSSIETYSWFSKALSVEFRDKTVNLHLTGTVPLFSTTQKLTFGKLTMWLSKMVSSPGIIFLHFIDWNCSHTSSS